MAVLISIFKSEALGPGGMGLPVDTENGGACQVHSVIRQRRVMEAAGGTLDGAGHAMRRNS